MKDIMGIEIENMSAASAVRRIMGLLAREPLSVCTVLRADMLLLAEKDEEYREYLSQTALRIVGDAAILKAMGEERKDRLEELENHSFQTQLLKELSENGRPVAVLTETEAEKEISVSAGCDFIQGYYYSRVYPQYEAINFYKKSPLSSI